MSRSSRPAAARNPGTQRRDLRPLRRRELIGIVTCARPCRVRVVTTLRRIRYVRRLRIAAGASRRVCLKQNARQRKARRRLGRARVRVTVRGRTTTLRVRR